MNQLKNNNPDFQVGGDRYETVGFSLD